MAPILETAVSLLALAGTVAEATPLLKPGRHASPGVANVLSSSKRSLHNLLARYYGSTYGFTKPSPLPEKRDTSLPDGWSVFGCVAESTDERLLQGFAFSSSSLTPLLCVNECTKLGYTMAGTEYGDECYCGNSYSGNGGGLADDSTCGMGCGGDSSETCGTTWYLNLYTYNSSSLASCSSDSTTTSSVASVSASSTVSESFASATESATSSLDLATLIADASSTESASSSQITGTETASSAVAAVDLAHLSFSLSFGISIGDGESATATSSEAGATITASATSSVATSSSTSTASIYEDSDNASEWYALGCAIDSSDRVLSEYSVSMSDMTVNSCLSACEDLGYKYAGVEFGEECYCSSTLASAVTYDEDQCNVVCNGDEEETCGGTWAIEIFELISSAVSSSCSNSTASATSSVASLTSGVSVSVTASASSSAATSISETLSESASETVSQSASANETESATASMTVSSTESVSVSASTTATASGSATTADSTTVPSSSADHQVWAHHMVGNTYSYTSSNWASDIASATAAGIDGFALNIGSDSWGSSRVSDAYEAAGSSGFKLFLSLDMTSLACASSSDAANLVSLVTQFASKSAQATYNDKVVVSTFAGSDCAIDWQTSFVDALTAAGIDIFFIPSLFSDVSTFSSNTWMDGELNWNSGWPMGSTDLTTDSDKSYISALGDKVYAAAVSPFFYTHFSASSWNKNWLYRSDDWLYCTRWEQLISMRETVKLAEILTWNDYGESSYIGSISGDLPSGSEAFVNGMTHTGLLSLTNYYATAFKTGAYPSITEDELVMWARPHPHDATATSDSIGKPTGYSYTEDYLYAVVMTTEAATVTLTSGSTTESFSVEAGLTKLKISLAAGSISGTITRSGSTVASYDAGSDFSYTTSPTTYNYNYFVGSSSS